MRKRKPQENDIKLTVTVDRDLWLWLKDRANQETRSLNDLLNEWIEERRKATAQPQSASPPDTGSKGGLYVRNPVVCAPSRTCDGS
jgi:hypothetical protein